MPIDASKVEWDSIDPNEVKWDDIDPTKGMSGTEKFLAGAGKAFTDAARGVQQIIPAGAALGGAGLDEQGNPTDPAAAQFYESENQRQRDLQQEIDESRRLDAPLMRTGAGIAGNIAGNIAMAAPTMAVPGANTVTGAGVIGAIQGAVQPTATGESRAQNVATGAVAGAATQGAFNVGGKILHGAAASNVAKTAARKTEDAVKNEVIREAKEVGYVLPPSQAKPSLLNRFLEGVSGKIQTAQKASIKNQDVTNDLVRKALGLNGDAPITPGVLAQVREQAGDAYQAIKDIGKPLVSTRNYRQTLAKIGSEWNAASKEFPNLVKDKEIKELVGDLNKKYISPEGAVEMIKKLRFDASANIKNSDDSVKMALGFAQKKAANALEDLIESNLQKSGQGGLVSQFRKSRELIAKAHAVEDALNESTGNVSARYLGKLLDKGVPLTGELRTAARFAKTFEKAAQDVEKVGSLPGFSPLDVAAGGIASAASGNPALLAAVAGRPAIRSVILSKPYQNAFTTPSYKPSQMLRLSSEAVSSNLLRGGAVLGVPAYKLSQDDTNSAF